MRQRLLAVGALALLIAACAARERNGLGGGDGAPALPRSECRVVFADYFGTWCEPCRRMDASWADPAVVGALGERAVLVKVDADGQVELAGQFGVIALPTTIATIEGREVDRFTGYAPPEALVRFIRSVLAGTPASERLEREIAGATAANDNPGRRRAQLELLGVLARTGNAAGELALLAELWLDQDLTVLVAAHRATRDLRARGVDLSSLTPVLDGLEARARAGDTRAWGAWAELASAMGRSPAVAQVLVGEDGVAAKGVADHSWTYTLPVRLAEDSQGRALVKLVDLTSPSVGAWAKFFAGDDRSAYTAWQRQQSDRTSADDARTLAVVHVQCEAMGRDKDAADAARWLLARFSATRAREALDAARSMATATDRP